MVQRHGELPEIVGACRPLCRGSGFLNSSKCQTDQDADQTNDDEQLNEREATITPRHVASEPQDIVGP
jgi:hypothetical protein